MEEVVLRLCLSPSIYLPYRQCFKRQLVDLVMEGVWQELLDSAQIEIVIADGGSEDGMCHPEPQRCSWSWLQG